MNQQQHASSYTTDNSIFLIDQAGLWSCFAQLQTLLATIFAILQIRILQHHEENRLTQP